jgi:hypothetical protein
MSDVVIPRARAVRYERGLLTASINSSGFFRQYLQQHHRTSVLFNNCPEALCAVTWFHYLYQFPRSVRKSSEDGSAR